MNNYLVSVGYTREGTPQVFSGTFLGFSGSDAILRARAFVRSYLKPECINSAVIMRSVDI